MIERILLSSTPDDLIGLLSKYPKIVAEIRSNPKSAYYEKFYNVVKRAKEKCYGK